LRKVVRAVNQAGGGNLVDHLESVVLRHIGDVDQGAVDSVRDLRASVLRGGPFGESQVNERHDDFLSMDGERRDRLQLNALGACSAQG
jgi:hypothetical protein